MAEVTAFRNNALSYPVYGMPWAVVFPLFDADGDPVTGAICDSEISKDGDTGVDCTNDGEEIPFTSAGNKGQYYLLLTAAEMLAGIVIVSVASATSKSTVIALYPRKLPLLMQGTSPGGGGPSQIVFEAGTFLPVDLAYAGCLCKIYDGTGVGQVRLLVGFLASGVGVVDPAWEVTPDDSSAYGIYVPEGMYISGANLLGIAGAALNPASAQLGTNVVTVKGGALTSGCIPNAAAGGAGGLPTVDASNKVAGVAGAVGSVTAGVTLADAAITAAKFAADAIAAAAVKADAVTKVQSGLATPTNITAASGVSLAPSQHVIVDSGVVTTLTNLPTIPANWLKPAGIEAAALNGKGDWSIHNAAAVKTAIEADGSKIDHLWETTEDDGGVRRFTENALEEAPSGTGGDATAANQAAILEAIGDLPIPGDATAATQATILAAVNAIAGGVGSGPVEHPYTVLVDGLPAADVLVLMSTDAAGANMIHGGRTDALGVVYFRPDVPADTTLYLWRYKTGLDFDNPDVEVSHD